MTVSSERQTKRGAHAIAELVGRVIDPLTRKRGFVTSGLLSSWPEIVGPRFAAITRPAKVTWPRGSANEGAAGVLTLDVEGPSAILVQHEIGQILERVNAFLGYRAIAQIRIVQAPVPSGKRRRRPAETVLAAEESGRIASATAAVDNDELRAALERLGRGVVGSRNTR
jgi:hypothetical protein